MIGRFASGIGFPLAQLRLGFGEQLPCLLAGSGRHLGHHRRRRLRAWFSQQLLQILFLKAHRMPDVSDPPLLVHHEGDADIFIHYSQIDSGQRFRTLRTGQRVQYEIDDGDKGIHAINVLVLDDGEENIDNGVDGVGGVNGSVGVGGGGDGDVEESNFPQDDDS